METENSHKLSFGKIFLMIILGLWIAFLVYFAIMSMIAPSKKLEEIRKEYTQDKSEKKQSGRKETDKKAPVKKDNDQPRKVVEKNDIDKKISTESEYINQLRERAYLQSRIIMAETDSIYLTINSYDSTMNLEISGVVVHSAHFNNFQASSILVKGNENLISTMLSTPLTIASDLSTIKKEPVMIKMAPKDTSEYKPDIMPDTSLTEPVNYILEMTNGIRIYVYQLENDKKEDRHAAFRFDMDDRLKQTMDALRRVIAFQVPDYHPFIKIRVPRSDAKIIYRAIPKNGQITLLL
jgi:hypothetical protein